MWQWLLEYNEDFALGGKPDLVRLLLAFPNGSTIKLGGAKDQGQAGRWRGRGYDLVIIDECQTFPSHLRDLVESVLLPTMLKEGGHGRLVMMGTPAEVPGVGYWEEKVAESAMFGDPDWAERVSAGDWSKHKWSLYQNPHLGKPEEVEAFLERMAKTMGGRHASRFQREFLGLRPAPDAIDRPYQYDPAKCDPETCGYTMPLAADSYVKREANRWEIYNRWELPLGGTWIFTLGIDLGSRAASAMAVLGSTDAAPGKVFLVEEWLATRRLPSAIRDRIIDRRGAYNFKVMVVDEGALGDMIAGEWRDPPYSLPVMAAEKLAEQVHCDFVSAAMVRGEFMVPKGSRLAQDMAVLRWDPKKLENGKRKVALDPHSDIEPATRYAFKDAHAFAQGTRPPKPVPKTETENAQADLEREKREGAKRSRKTGFEQMASRGALAAWKR